MRVLRDAKAFVLLVLAVCAIICSYTLPAPAGSSGAVQGVADTRTINTTSPVAGGGDLSADRTITFSNTYVDPSINGFRLSLTAGTAVTTADVTAATEINLVSYTANRIALWDGSEWDLLESDAVAPLALGTLSNNTNYDVYTYNNSGVITLDTPVAWTNDTTRATALVRQDGVWCKTGDLTRRYAGTFRTTATTTTEDSAAKRFLFNADNRVRRSLYVSDATGHTYDTAAWRQWRAQAANQFAFVVGLPVQHMEAGINVVAKHSVVVTQFYAGLKLDATNGADNPLTSIFATEADTFLSVYFPYSFAPAVGYHFVAAVQYGAGATTTFSAMSLFGGVFQ